MALNAEGGGNVFVDRGRSEYKPLLRVNHHQPYMTDFRPLAILASHRTRNEENYRQGEQEESGIRRYEANEQHHRNDVYHRRQQFVDHQRPSKNQ